jgi:hypothetical protein
MAPSIQGPADIACRVFQRISNPDQLSEVASYVSIICQALLPLDTALTLATLEGLTA